MKECIYRIPKFLSNTILRSKDLSSVNKNIYNAGLFEYENYANGIISGLDVDVKGNKLIVNKGIFKNKDVIYLDEILSINIPASEGEYILVIKFSEVEKEYANEKIITLSLEKNEEYDGIEIARFNIREGAKLIKGDYEIKKFEKEYNTLDFSKSIHSKTYINPKLLEKWSELMLKKTKTSFDMLFCFLCKLELVNKFILIKYINKKLDTNYQKLSNTEILSNLYKILDEEDGNFGNDTENLNEINFG